MCGSEFLSGGEASTHICIDFAHVQLLQVRTHLDAKVDVTFFIVHQIPVKCQFLQLPAVFETGYVFKLLDVVIRQKDALQFGAVGQPRDALN